jgi:serine/threonine-protein kinase
VSHAEAGVQEGQILAGKYRIEKVLGVGGMGVVVAARHMQLDTKVAIKFLVPEMLGNGEAVARFAREAKAAVKITGEHVARVLDVGTLETGAPYMVMEFLEGSDLSALLHQRGSLPVDQAVEFVLQASVAVAEAHALGIVHRDLKPANLFCIRRADGKLSVKVLDFGISKVTDPNASDSGMSVTKTSAMMGSPLYMSPEQMQASKSVDARADIWALGVILYELLTTKVPFEGETITDVAIKVATQPAASIRTLRPEIPAALDAAILRSLEKQRESRYQSVAEFALALNDFAPPRAKPLVERICDIQQVSAPVSHVTNPDLAAPEHVPSSVTAGPSATISAVARTAGEPSRPNRKPLVFAILGVVSGLGIAAVALVTLHRTPAEQPPVAAAALAAPPPPAASSASSVSLAPLAAGQPAPPPSPEPPAVHASDTPAPPPPPAPSAARGVAPRPGFKGGGGKTAATPPAGASAAPSPVSPPAPPPAAPTPKPTNKNSLDLGGFQ